MRIRSHCGLLPYLGVGRGGTINSPAGAVISESWRRGHGNGMGGGKTPAARAIWGGGGSMQTVAKTTFALSSCFLLLCGSEWGSASHACAREQLTYTLASMPTQCRFETRAMSCAQTLHDKTPMGALTGHVPWQPFVPVPCGPCSKAAPKT